MNKLLLLILIVFTSCKGYDHTIIERQKSVTEVCPTCVLTLATTVNYGVKTDNSLWIAQDTAKSPNIIYQVVFCDGIFQPISKVSYLTKIN